MRILPLLLLVAAAGAQPAVALTVEPLVGPPGAATEAPPGVTSWDLLGKATVLFEERDGAHTATTLIPPEVEALDGRSLKLAGFMFPIEAETPTRAFLLVELPADCPFCLAGTTEPSRMVEVRARRAVELAQDQVVVSGRLEVVRDDVNGLVYRLHDAELVE